ncbi:MAG TPA: DUF1801 domain-containing protein [Polyangiaceae bacterium]|nr:DUF1801 domain-containing protein [Polyangiaceae bacterium]
MQKSTPAVSPDAYVAALGGWQRACVERLRKVVRVTPALVETVKWGHLVYLSNGPAVLIRAEEQRVLFGFWRGQRLRSIEPRLKPGGKYEMASLELREGTTLSVHTVKRLTREAVALNESVGDPTKSVSAKKTRAPSSALNPRRPNKTHAQQARRTKSTTRQYY